MHHLRSHVAGALLLLGLASAQVRCVVGQGQAWRGLGK